MNWEPAHADHSIETINVVFALATPLDPDLFDEVLVAARKAAVGHQFSNRVEGVEPIQIQGELGAEIVVNFAATPHRRRVGFQRLEDGKAIGEFAVGASSVTLTFSRYSSWNAFKSMTTELMRPLQLVALFLDGVKSVQLQYVDRFTSTVIQADVFEVISKTSSLIVPVLNAKKLALHSHTGWFDHIDDKKRRLTNVNVDLIDNSPPGAPDAMSRLGILTMARLDALQQGTLEDPLNELDGLHYYLKDLFKDTITKEAAGRVSL